MMKFLKLLDKISYILVCKDVMLCFHFWYMNETSKKEFPCKNLIHRILFGAVM